MSFSAVRQAIPSSALAALAIVLLVAACAQTTSRAVDADKDVSTALDRASAALTQSEGPDWIEGAVELAAAFQQSGDHQQASILLDQAWERSETVIKATDRSASLLAVTDGRISAGDINSATAGLKQVQAAIESIADEPKRWDMLGKLARARAEVGQHEEALAAANAMPATDYALSAYKARTLGEIAPILADQGDQQAALDTLKSINMGLAYYQAIARSKVAVIAKQNNAPEVAKMLLTEADEIGRAQEDGYFIAGALRYIGQAYSAMDDSETARKYFSDALEGAKKGMTAQHRARARSRVATGYSDFGFFNEARAALPVAVDTAQQEANETLRYWAFYEIAGSAAFAGDFEIANRLLDSIPGSVAFGDKSLKAAAQRDVAWGYARHGKAPDAMRVADGIEQPRERVQAYSRIARVLTDRKMKALPRYL